VHQTGSGLCPVVGFGVTDTEPSGPTSSALR
jgi:hypothetical protein